MMADQSFLNDGRRVLFSLVAKYQNYIAEADADLILPQAMGDADVVSCCLHAVGRNPQLQI